MTQPAEFPVSVAKVSVDPATTHDVIEIVGVRKGESLEHAELSFDQVEPGGFGRGEHGSDAKLAQEAEKARVVVDIVQVVQDHEEPLAWVAGPQPPEGVEEMGQPFLATKDPTQAIGVDVVEAEELFRALEPAVGRSPAQWPLPMRPGDSTDRLELQGPPFVEANYRRERRTLAVELSDAFFFRSKSGS